MYDFTPVGLLVVIAVIVILFAIFEGAEQYQTADCSTFASQTISRIPARCLSYYGTDSVQ